MDHVVKQEQEWVRRAEGGDEGGLVRDRTSKGGVLRRSSIECNLFFIHNHDLICAI